jgi:NTE family protein
MEYDIVFEGGGAKGMVFVGAIQELEARGHTPARLLGVSAGAIMATFLAAGYNSTEMAEALNEKQDGQPVFLGFLEKPPELTPEQIKNSTIREVLRSYNMKLVPDFLEEGIDDQIATFISTSPSTGRICSFIELGGFYAAKNFLDWLKTKLDSGTYPLERGKFGSGNPRRFGSMTLDQFFDATGAELSLVASDTSDSRILVLNRHTAPNCPIVWAVRMSMSFPMLWNEVVWQPAWGRYMERDINGHTIVDGGMLSNFPIELFLSDQEYILKLMGESHADPSSVLGFLIDERIEVPGTETAPPATHQFSINQLKPVDRVMKLINTMTQAHDKMVIDSYEKYVVHLPAKGYGTIEFGMSEKRRDALVSAGRNATQAYFNRLERARLEEAVSFGELVVQESPLEAANRIASRILSP